MAGPSKVLELSYLNLLAGLADFYDFFCFYAGKNSSIFVLIHLIDFAWISHCNYYTVKGKLSIKWHLLPYSTRLLPKFCGTIVRNNIFKRRKTHAHFDERKERGLIFKRLMKKLCVKPQKRSSFLLYWLRSNC